MLTSGGVERARVARAGPGVDDFTTHVLAPPIDTDREAFKGSSATDEPELNASAPGFAPHTR
jgi:hypothetical protein